MRWVCKDLMSSNRSTCVTGSTSSCASPYGPRRYRSRCRPCIPRARTSTSGPHSWSETAGPSSRRDARGASASHPRPSPSPPPPWRFASRDGRTRTRACSSACSFGARRVPCICSRSRRRGRRWFRRRGGRSRIPRRRRPFWMRPLSSYRMRFGTRRSLLTKSRNRRRRRRRRDIRPTCGDGRCCGCCQSCKRGVGSKGSVARPPRPSCHPHHLLRPRCT
mmetsp:Transcript_30982/g.74876  ORF Transcript_30982/g.74876 Transcript_30982/m.74876 type:complete len:220 (-) Transcript_30982:411-1070(-)